MSWSRVRACVRVCTGAGMHIAVYRLAWLCFIHFFSPLTIGQSERISYLLSCEQSNERARSWNSDVAAVVCARVRVCTGSDIVRDKAQPCLKEEPQSMYTLCSNSLLVGWAIHDTQDAAAAAFLPASAANCIFSSSSVNADV